MKLFNYVIEVGTARWPWTYFRVHKYDTHRHIVWGKRSLIIGQPHLEEIAICACCRSTEIGEKGAGDESWTVCDDCGAIEQGYEYITMEQAEEEGLV